MAKNERTWREHKRPQIGLRLPPELDDAIRQSAEANGRTLTKEIELAIRAYLAANKPTSKAK